MLDLLMDDTAPTLVDPTTQALNQKNFEVSETKRPCKERVTPTPDAVAGTAAAPTAAAFVGAAAGSGGAVAFPNGGAIIGALGIPSVLNHLVVAIQELRLVQSQQLQWQMQIIQAATFVQQAAHTAGLGVPVAAPVAGSTAASSAAVIGATPTSAAAAWVMVPRCPCLTLWFRRQW